MQASGHIGKLVLVPELGNAGDQAATAAARSRCARDGTYLVTGGISGFGFAAARWLAAHGAGSIALLGRRGGDTPGAGERVAELRALGADVRLYAADVADPASLSAALDDIRRNQPPLRGVIHAASAIADGLAADLDGAAIRDMLRPKLGGAIAARPPDPSRSDRAVRAVLLGDDPARRAGSGGLCRGQSRARSAGAAAAGRGPAGARGRLGADRGCRLSGGTPGDPRRAGAPARRQADAGGAGPGGAAGDARQRFAA